ncbi:sensor histidine kinase [Deinococcus sonorensis]|uniref:Sensor histidine kinase n=2 Tax=Deinococcus sonorensis TaxID=309891 RepID=A0AAU7U926_9DEIO
MRFRRHSFSPSLSLAGRYSLLSFGVLLLCGLLIGAWVSRSIRDGVVHRTAASAALYVENYVVGSFQGFSRSGGLTAQERRQLNWILTKTPLAQEIVAIRIWGPGGRVIYGQDEGRTFDVKDEQADAWNGQVVSHVSTLEDAENGTQRARWNRLLETYTPLRQEGSDRVIAVAEFYQTVDDLERQQAAATRESWGVVTLTMLGAYLLLAGVVRQGSDTILHQQRQLQAELQRNEELHHRVSRAATRTTTLNERYLMRVSAELHDGPAQELGYALLRLEGVGQHLTQLPAEQAHQAEQHLELIERSLRAAMTEMRDISSGLRLPALDGLDLDQTIQRAVQDHQRRTGTTVTLQTDGPLPAAALPVRMTAYRLVQEALNNAQRHAGGQHMTVQCVIQGAQLRLEVQDHGPGFDALQPQPGHLHLGLNGMRERTESLGGTFEVRSGPHGTQVLACLPLHPPGDSPEAELEALTP